MSKNSAIEWTDHTFNPWEGCQKVGPGCDLCYAERRNARFGGGTAINWGPGAPRRRTSAANWAKPIAWDKAHAEFFAVHGRRQRVFCASLADVFDNAVSAQWRFDLLKLIEATPNLDWLLLTKRIGNAAAMLEQATRAITHGREGWADNYFPNVWIGATVVNQEEANRDVPKLRQVPAHRRFLSMEPLLGSVCLGQPSRGGTGPEGNIHWVIAGGESGPGARPMHPDWARKLRDDCARNEIPFLFKQWGEWLPAMHTRSVLGKTLTVEGEAPFTDKPEWHVFGASGRGVEYVHMARIGKKAAGRRLDGVVHDGFPSVEARGGRTA